MKQVDTVSFQMVVRIDQWTDSNSHCPGVYHKKIVGQERNQEDIQVCLRQSSRGDVHWDWIETEVAICETQA
jgi:hypothetical protein